VQILSEKKRVYLKKLKNELSFVLFQGLAELTFDMVSSGPSHMSSRGSTTQATHPAELREGIANAYSVLTEVSG